MRSEFIGARDFLSTRAIRYTEKVAGRNRIVGLACPTCQQTWNVRNRGRETGFIVAAADSHTHRCAREKHEASDRPTAQGAGDLCPAVQAGTAQGETK